MVRFSFLFLLLAAWASFSSFALAEDGKCPGMDDPPPPILKPDMPKLIASLENLRDVAGRSVWKTTEETKKELNEIFDAVPSKTKLEQFFQVLFLFQRKIKKRDLPMVVEATGGFTDVLLAAKVFTDPAFPKKITSVRLAHDDPNRNPVYTLEFAAPEVRFPINAGKGFASWDQGMCQIAKELVFYNGFSFRVRPNRVNRTLVVDDFARGELFGTFGSPGMFDIDLNYVELDKVEFIKGTDQGKVKARVAQREFKENKHSGMFKFIGGLIPNTSKQRIDW